MGKLWIQESRRISCIFCFRSRFGSSYSVTMKLSTLVLILLCCATARPQLTSGIVKVLVRTQTNRDIINAACGESRWWKTLWTPTQMTLVGLVLSALALTRLRRVLEAIAATGLNPLLVGAILKAFAFSAKLIATGVISSGVELFALRWWLSFASLPSQCARN